MSSDGPPATASGPETSRPNGHPALRATARVLGVVVSVLWLVPLVGGVISEDQGSTSEGGELEGFLLGGLVTVAIISTGFAAFGRRRAAWVVLAAGSALSVFALATAGRNHWLAVSVAGIPWLVIGGLFVVADRRPPTHGS